MSLPMLTKGFVHPRWTRREAMLRMASGFGMLGLSSMLSSGSEPVCAQANALSCEGEADHLSRDEWRHVARGYVRSQANAHEVQRSSDAWRSSEDGEVYGQPVRLAVRISKVWTKRNRGFRDISAGRKPDR